MNEVRNTVIIHNHNPRVSVRVDDATGDIHVAEKVDFVLPELVDRDQIWRDVRIDAMVADAINRPSRKRRDRQAQ